MNTIYHQIYVVSFCVLQSTALPPLPPGVINKPIELSNTTVDVNIRTGNVTATIRGLSFSYGRSFRGIPYAQPPIGTLRFAYAQRKDPSGMVNATAYGPACTQKPMIMSAAPTENSSSEDCLFINVFTPLNSTANSKLPVYMFYHFGGYEGGDGNMDEGIFPNLVNRGPIIMVSMNYRVGPFGFFTTRESTAAGNWATSDWIEALNWVNRYISFFGGDPQRITIGGQSAGAESVSALTMTPQSKSLFKQAILESGSSFDASIMSYSEKTRNTSEYLAVALNCTSETQWTRKTNLAGMLSCMRKATPAQIMAADASLPSHRSKWSLVQDKKYFPESLESLASRRDKSIKVLCGNVNSEWMFFEDGAYMTNQLNSSRNSGTQLEKDLASSYEMTYYNNQSAVQSAADQLYIQNNDWADDDHLNWEVKRLQLWSEMVFVGPVLRDASFFRSNGNTVYLYSMDWLSPNAHPEITESALRGVEHGWELQYLFETTCQFYNCTIGDNLLRQYVSTAWVNFIKFGKPTPSGSSLPFRWLPMDQTNRYLSFSPTPSMKSNYHPTANFWACTAPSIDGYNGSFCAMQL